MIIRREAILIDNEAASVGEAILAAGNALQASGACSAEYVQAMLSNYREFGPYFVIAPGLATPHARPEQGALKAQLSFVRLRSPVVFGHAENDPLQLVLGLSATGQDEHIVLIQHLVTLLGDEATYHLFLNSSDPDQIFGCFTHS